MGKTLFETLMGAVVLAVAVLFFVFAYTRSDVATVEGYEVVAKFTSVAGLHVGDDMRISGIKIGSVIGQELDPVMYRAIVRMSIDPAIELPEDTIAAVYSESLLGGKYMALDPGGAEELIGPGGEIKMTQSAINLEGLPGKFIYGSTDDGQ